MTDFKAGDRVNLIKFGGDKYRRPVTGTVVSVGMYVNVDFSENTGYPYPQNCKSLPCLAAELQQAFKNGERVRINANWFNQMPMSYDETTYVGKIGTVCNPMKGGFVDVYLDDPPQDAEKVFLAYPHELDRV